MKTIYANQLSSHLAPLSTCTLLVGPESFLIQESSLRLRAVAKAQGFEERVLFTLETAASFEWGALRQALHSPSLFSQKQLIEWVWFEHPSDKQLSLIEALFPLPKTIILVIRAGHLSKANMQTKWFKALSNDALLVQHWPLQGRDWGLWLHAQMETHQVSLRPEAHQWLSEHFLGQTYPVSQLLMRLALMPPEASLEAVQALATEQSEHDVFDLQNAMMAQKPVSVLRLLTHFKHMKTELTLVLWCVSRLVQALYVAQVDNVSAPFWLLPRDHNAFLVMKQRTTVLQLEDHLQSLSVIDRLGKTGHLDESWQRLSSLCVNISDAKQNITLS